MKKLLISTLFLAVFGCDDDDDNVSRSRRDARLVDVEVPAEDIGASDRGDLDSELPVADGILPPLDAELPLVDSGLVDAEAPLVDAEAPAADLALVDGTVDPDDAGAVVDAALSDM